MRLFPRRSRTCIFAAFVFAIFLAGSQKFFTLAGQNESSAPQELIESLQITANDEIAADDIAAHHIHLQPLRSHAAQRGSYEDAEVNRGTPRQESPAGEPNTLSSAVSTVPGVPAPGFYPADLSNPAHGPVLTTAQSNNVYVNCVASCWGTPASFLARLATSTFIHLVDQYVGNTGNSRYTVGTASSITATLPAKLTSANILQLVHTAAHAHGSGYGHVYHIFLPSGVDVCTSTNVCYSPNDSATFKFCAYHAGVDFTDIGRVLYTVEPDQNVAGCSVAQTSPNGALVDSTSSTLSHELIETITDPDGDAWYGRNSLPDFGAEIGDICENPFGSYAAFTISGKSYAIQPEYSNHYHACSTAP